MEIFDFIEDVAKLTDVKVDEERLINEFTNMIYRYVSMSESK